ncbi:MAG: ATP-binding protein [Bacteroidales bacterium]|nr:ATP-binding protein [Bacteroidales bacterium]
MEDPFVFGTATSEPCFTDRENETQRLKMNFLHGINTMLISPRRWGKTSLVKHVADSLKNEKDVKVVMMDIFSCRNEHQFYKMFATEIIKQTSSKWEEWVADAKKFLGGLVPKISLDVDPVTDLTFSFEFSETHFNTDVLSLPEKIAESKGIKVVVCIDEFQQIADFSDSLLFQKKMRSVWQLQQNVTYCLFGSKKHILAGLFSKPSCPFYKFGDIMFLQKIPTSYWSDFIMSRFAATGKSISKELTEEICAFVENHSSYVQQLSWIVWTKTEKTATREILEKSKTELLNQSSILFQNYIDELTGFQINFLLAMSDGIQSEFSRKEILTRYDLGTAANITRLKKSLEDKDLIDIEAKKVTFNDPVFAHWIRLNIVR